MSLEDIFSIYNKQYLASAAEKFKNCSKKELDIVLGAYTVIQVDKKGTTRANYLSTITDTFSDLNMNSILKSYLESLLYNEGKKAYLPLHQSISYLKNTKGIGISDQALYDTYIHFPATKRSLSQIKKFINDDCGGIDQWYKSLVKAFGLD